MRIYKIGAKYLAMYHKPNNAGHFTVQGNTRLEVIKQVLAELSLYQTGFLIL